MSEDEVFNLDVDAPCKLACPAGIDVPLYCSLIGQGKYVEALSVIREKVPFPAILGRVCPSPCEADCRLGQVSQPMMIKALKRFVGDKQLSGEISWSPKKGNKASGRVAVIGSGPSGLTVAYFLTLKGYQVTVFEKLPVSGGMMAVGIPDYRLPRDVLVSEIAVLKDMGIEIKNGVSFGKDITLEGLSKEGYGAVFLGVGLHLGRELNVKGEDLEGIMQGVDFLRKVNLGEKVSIGKKVLVVGGGNVAVDVALVSLRSGAEEVTMACLEQEDEIPALDEEIEEALEEGVFILNGWGPKEFQGENGCVQGVEFMCCESVFDSSGRFNPQYDECTLKNLDVNTVILAIGQKANLDFASSAGLDITASGGLKVFPETLETNIKGVFAGGEVTTGPGALIEAISSGRKAASQIDRYLGGDGVVDPKPMLFEDSPFLLEEWVPAGEAETLKKIPVAERKKGFDEIVMGLQKDQALYQAKRCLRCDLPVVIDVNQCCGCFICELRCSMRKVGEFNLGKANIEVRRQVDKEYEFSVSLTEECDNCGLCVRYCPYGTLTRGKGERV
ncbi:MAG: FAD-dependent oxidoreductase [Deltaproteobacteria bacterium]|nr:FAD-dependent oxidoreductase [Deltaproteobacteria bacterium]